MSDISRLELVIDSKGVVTANGNLDLFKKKSDDAAKSAKKVGDQAKTSFGDDLTRSLFGPMTAANLAADGIKKIASGFKDLVASSLEASGQLEMIRANLTTVMGSAELAGKTFEELKEFAARTPFEMPGITESAIMLKQSGVAAGDLISTLSALGDAAGGSQEKLNRIALNYAQIQAVGKATTMDIKQFAMAGLPIYDALAKSLGVNNEQLGDMISNGKVTKDVVVQAFKDMTSEGGAFFKGMERGAVTLEGRISTLNDTWKTLRATIVDTLGISEGTKGGAVALTELLAGINSNFEFFSAQNAVNAGNATDAQVALVAEARVKAIREALQKNQAMMEDYRNSPGFGLGGGVDLQTEQLEAQNNVLLNNLAYWQDRLSVITQKEEYLAGLEAQRAAGLKDTEASLKAYADAQVKATSEMEKWQKVLKNALDLDEVTTGRKAIIDYKQDIEDQINGSIAYAQAFGGKVSDIYLEYAEKVQNAIKTLMASGRFSMNDDAIKGLIKLENMLQNGSYQNEMNYNFSVTSGNIFGNLPEKADKVSSALELLRQNIEESAKNKDWSSYAKYYSMQAGLNSIQGTDAGNFAQGAMQGGWQNGLINMVVGAFMKILDDSEGFQRALNLVTEALGPAGELLGDVMDALAPLMDALVIGGEIGQDLAEVTLMLEPVIPLIKFISTVIYVVSVVLQKAFDVLNDFTSWLFGDITDGMNEFSDSMYKASESVDDTTEDLIQALKDLKDQIEEEQRYYETQRDHLNATSDDQTYAVQDAIIAPGGKVITTHPDDYLIATKTPGSLGGGTTEVRIESIVQNYASGSVTVEQKKRVGIDGNAQLITVVRQIVKNDVATGELDDAFDAMSVRRGGIRRGS